MAAIYTENWNVRSGPIVSLYKYFPRDRNRTSPAPPRWGRLSAIRARESAPRDEIRPGDGRDGAARGRVRAPRGSDAWQGRERVTAAARDLPLARNRSRPRTEDRGGRVGLEFESLISAER